MSAAVNCKYSSCVMPKVINCPKLLNLKYTKTQMNTFGRRTLKLAEYNDGKSGPKYDFDVWKIPLCLCASYPCSQRQVAEKNLKDGEKREEGRNGSKTRDCHRKKKKEQKTQYIPEIFSAVVDRAWCLQMQTCQAQTHTGTPTGLKNRTKKIVPGWNEK